MKSDSSNRGNVSCDSIRGVAGGCSVKALLSCVCRGFETEEFEMPVSWPLECKKHDEVQDGGKCYTDYAVFMCKSDSVVRQADKTFKPNHMKF